MDLSKRIQKLIDKHPEVLIPFVFRLCENCKVSEEQTPEPKKALQRCLDHIQNHSPCLEVFLKTVSVFDF